MNLSTLARPGNIFRYRSAPLRKAYHYIARVLHPMTSLRRWRRRKTNEYGFMFGPHGDPIAAIREIKARIKGIDIPALRERSPKPYLLNLISGDQIDENSEIFKYVTNPKLVEEVAEYLGCLPVLTYIAVWFSPNDSHHGGGSQDYHLDHEDYRQIKGFLFIEDVTEDSGPMTIISAHESKTIQRAINYRMTAAEKRVPDEVMAEAAPISLTGPAGTLALVDTSNCFHYGSRIASRPRLVLTFQYVTPFAFVMPWNWKSGTRLRHIKSTSEYINRLIGNQL